MQPFDFFDGIAMSCGGLCAVLGWVYRREAQRSELLGFPLIGIALYLSAFAWIGSTWWGTLVYRGDWFSHLTVAIPALLATTCFLVGFRQYVQNAVGSPGVEVAALLLLFGVGVTSAVYIGPKWTNDAVITVLFLLCVRASLHRHRQMPGAGYGLIALALLLQPVIAFTIRFAGGDIEHMRQLLVLPFILMGMLVFAVGFSNSRSTVAAQLQKIQKVEAEQHQMLYQDAVTGLRSHYAQRELMHQLIAEKIPFSAIGISLNDFGLINDNFGPVGGNAVMVAAAAALREVLPENYELARASGARFSSIAVKVAPIEVREVLGRIMERFAKPMEWDVASVHVKLAIGVTFYPADSVNVDDIIRDASIAVHWANRRKLNEACFFEAWMQDEGKEQLWLDQNLRTALEQDQFELHYQPKMLLSDDSLSSVEALIRWTHPQRGNIPPDRFIGRCEANGLIIPLGRWIIQTAAQQAAKWVTAGRGLRIAINVSAIQLSDPGLMDHLAAAQSLANGMLDLELTESCFAENEERLTEFIHQCRDLGFGLHLDDFGTGYSSLSRLGSLRLTKIKLDRSFVVTIGRSEKDEMLIKAIVGMASGLQLAMVAEGVETPQQAAYLRQIGVSHAQGWLYAPAMRADKLDAWRLGATGVAEVVTK